MTNAYSYGLDEDSPGLVESLCDSEIGSGERCLSLLAGATLAGWVLSRASLTRMLIAAGGGYLIYRGATGRCPISAQFGCDRGGTAGPPLFKEWDESEEALHSPGAEEARRRSIIAPDEKNPMRSRDADLVDEASMESFPASDPPSYSSGAATPSMRPE